MTQISMDVTLYLEGDGEPESMLDLIRAVEDQLSGTDIKKRVSGYCFIIDSCESQNHPEVLD